MLAKHMYKWGFMREQYVRALAKLKNEKLYTTIENNTYKKANYNAYM